MACSVVLHAVALSGRVVGGGIPLFVLFPVMFVCFASAVVRGVLRALAEQEPRVDLTGSIPRLVLWPCIALIAYGFLFGSGSGSVTIQFGEELSAHKAEIFYGVMISFFAMALLFHIGLSAKEKPNPQGGANGRQTSGPQTDRTSPADASRRSP